MNPFTPHSINAAQQQQAYHGMIGNIGYYGLSHSSGVAQGNTNIKSQKLSAPPGTKLIKKENSMLGTISQDLKKFVLDHKSTIYVLAVLILADHLLFQGQFRERLHKMMNTLLGKVENMIEKKHE